jgi:hypothetical protein
MIDKIDLQAHHRYLISVKIPILHQLENWKDTLIKTYKETPRKEGKNDLTLNTPEFNELRNLILPAINEAAYYLFYNLDRQDNPLDGFINIYVQNNSLWEDRENYFNDTTNVHNHKKQQISGNLTGVTYVNIPKIGGEFQMFTYPGPESVIVKPEMGRFYFFPSWLYHRPLPHQDDIDRICINWSMIGDTIPVIKKYNIPW